MERTGFRVEFYSEIVVKQLASLPKSAQLLLKKAIQSRLETKPNEYGKPLLGNLKNHRRLRVSVYRIIYHVDEEKKLVTVKAIDYRRDVSQ